MGAVTPFARTQVYQDARSLRYGHVMVMTDQDHDGSHIKGLIINFLHTFYPSLLKLPGFLMEFITPIIKARVTTWQCARNVQTHTHIHAHAHARAHAPSTMRC
jgi:DNA gyrase/topoisomerase IV subunit B